MECFVYCAKSVHLLISLYFLWPGVFCDTVCVIDPERVIHRPSVYCVLGVNWYLQQRQQGRQSRGYHHECLVRCDWGVIVWESDSANLDLREIRLGCLAWGDLTHDLFDQYRNSEFETLLIIAQPSTAVGSNLEKDFRSVLSKQDEEWVSTKH